MKTTFIAMFQKREDGQLALKMHDGRKIELSAETKVQVCMSVICVCCK